MGMSIEELEMHDALDDDERPTPAVVTMSAEATRRAAAAATFLAAAGQSRKAFRKFDQRADSEVEPSRERRREFERKTPRGPPVDPALTADVPGHEPFKLHVTTFDSVLPDLPRARLGGPTYSSMRCLPTSTRMAPGCRFGTFSASSPPAGCPPPFVRVFWHS